MKTLTVTAAPGVSVPMEDKPRKYIAGEKSFTVPATVYYRRRIADGDLIEETAEPEHTAAKVKRGGAA